MCYGFYYDPFKWADLYESEEEFLQDLIDEKEGKNENNITNRADNVFG